MGKRKYISTPEVMWELYLKYEEDTKNRPFLQHDFVGKDAMDVRREKERCLTLEGFYEFVVDQDEINTTYPDLSDYFENKDNRYSDYVRICSRVRRRIRRDQIEGGMAGIYNPSITQRLNGLVDKTEQKQIVEQPMFDDEES